jgi:propanediol utilization protein
LAAEDLAFQVRRAVSEVVDRLVPINVSARHVHITKEHLEQLYGPGAQLTKLRDLRQPGEFAAEQTVAIVGPTGRVFETVRILGPTRSRTQVELSFNDGRFIGLELPARLSGDTAGTAPVVLLGPAGVVRLNEGAIRALRHIHIGPEAANRLGVKNGDRVRVRTAGPMGVLFSNVLIRMGERALIEMHIDTDEANAAGLGPHSYGHIEEGVAA